MSMPEGGPGGRGYDTHLNHHGDGYLTSPNGDGLSPASRLSPWQSVRVPMAAVVGFGASGAVWSVGAEVAGGLDERLETVEADIVIARAAREADIPTVTVNDVTGDPALVTDALEYEASGIETAMTAVEGVRWMATAAIAIGALRACQKLAKSSGGWKVLFASYMPSKSASLE